MRFIAGERARARARRRARRADPGGRAGVVQAMLVAGNELQELPYGPDGHPTRAARSRRTARARVNYVLYRAGVRPIAEIVEDNPLAQDYVTLGGAGSGPLGDDLRDRGADAARLRRHRGPSPRYEPQRHRRRPQPRRRRTALAHPRPHPDVGALVGPSPAGVVRWRAMAARKVDYLLIGGGLASANCARWLREEGADGEVLLVGREPDPPYNRPDCSKGYLRGEETREEAFFRPERVVEGAGHRAAHAHDRHRRWTSQARTAKLSNKEEIDFDKALIATGANVRRLNVDGLRARADPLPAHARQRRRDPRGRRRTPRRSC